MATVSGKELLTGLIICSGPYVLFIISLLVIFGFEDRVFVLIVPVSGHCLYFFSLFLLMPDHRIGCVI